MKGEKNCYFLIKVCSVCFSITQHMSDQHHWWAHQTKKCLRLAPPFAWTVICCRTPSPHVWIVNLNLVPNPHLSRKSFPSTLPRFSSASSLIFICFFMFTPGGRLLTPQACLSVNSTERTLPCSWELQMYVFKAEEAIVILLFFLPVFPDFASWSAVGNELFPGERLFLWICPFPTFCLCLCLTAAPLLSCLALLRQSENSAAATNEQVNSVARKTNQLPKFTVGECI